MKFTDKLHHKFSLFLTLTVTHVNEIVMKFDTVQCAQCSMYVLHASAMYVD